MIKKLKDLSIRSTVILVCALVICVLFATLVAVMWSRALPGQRLAGQPVFGQSYADLVAMANKEASKITIKFSNSQQQATPTLAQIGLSFQGDKTAAQTLSGNWYNRINRNTPLVYSLDQGQLKNYLHSTFPSDKIIAATDPSIVYDTNTAAFSVKPGTDGQDIDLSKIIAAVDELASSPQPSVLQLAYAKTKPVVPVSAVQPIADQATERTKLSFAFTYNGKVIYTVAPADIAPWITLAAKNTLQYDTDAVQKTITDQLSDLVNTAPQSLQQSGDTIISAGRNGSTFSNAPALANSVVAALQHNQSATLAVETTPIPFTIVKGDSNCLSNSAGGKLLLVSISKQYMWACNGTTLVSESAVTTGASGITNVDNSTPTGTWRIYSKSAGVYLNGSDINGSWHDYVSYWMPFYGGYGFHDASWQTIPYGSSLYTTQGSHGCVHLPLQEMAWVYSWASVGTTVSIKA